MPIKRRRNSGQGEGTDKESKGNRMSIDQPDAGITDKNSKVASKTDEVITVQKTSKNCKNDAIAVPAETPKEIPRTGAFTRSRVIKRPKRDISPPESPVKKSVTKDPKTNTPETKTKRQWELWSTQDKDSFFEALFEHGKDFDAIQNWIASKCRRRGVVPALIKNKDQVRHLYYRTWHKISKHLDITDDVKKETQELYGIINYGALRKRIKTGILNEKEGIKLKELVHKGYTTVKIRGKTQRIKTPICNALKKLNNVDAEKTEPAVKVPNKVYIEMTPKSNEAWAEIQGMSLNPRVRMMLKSDRKLSSVLKFLENKWKPHRLKLKENLTSEPEELKKVLTVFPHRECDIIPVSLECIKETKLNLALNNYRQFVLNSESPTACKSKKNDTSKNPTNCDNNSLEAPPVIFDSPAAKGSKECNSSVTETLSRAPSLDVSAMVDGDNAMFPDAPFSTSREEEVSSDKTECASGTIEMFVKNLNRGCDQRVTVTSSPIGTKNVIANSENDQNMGPDRYSDSSQDLEVLETRKTNMIMEKGLTRESAVNLTLAEMYLMFGKDGKLRLEYEWIKDDSAAMLASNLTNLLRRLVNLATIEVTDISTKSTSNSASPCHACGTMRSRGKSAIHSKGQRSGGRSPLSSKSAAVDGFVDVGTQTLESSPSKWADNSNQGKDAVFRVPVCSPAFLQMKPPHTMASRQIIHSNNLFPIQSKGIRKIRNNTRKPSQRNILPKAMQQQQHQMLTIVRPLQNAHSVPLNLHPSPIPSPMSMSNDSISSSGSLVQNLLHSSRQGTPSKTVSTEESNTMNEILNNMSYNVVSSSQSTSCVVSHNPDTSTSLSPPNIGSLLDISLSNLPASGGTTESSDRLIDLALGSSNTFSALLNSTGKESSTALGNDSLLNTPTKHSQNEIQDQNSPWLNSGENTELSFMDILRDTPVKQSSGSSLVEMASAVAGNSHLVAPLFSESSRDSIVDYTLQSMMNESSMDYATKFMDLAAHINSSTDHSLNGIKKSDTNG